MLYDAVILYISEIKQTLHIANPCCHLKLYSDYVFFKQNNKSSYTVSYQSLFIKPRTSNIGQVTHFFLGISADVDSPFIQLSVAPINGDLELLHLWLSLYTNCAKPRSCMSRTRLLLDKPAADIFFPTLHIL